MPPPAPPAPPPPPPPPAASDGPSVEDAAGALFAEISKLGEGGRGGLKKATRGPVNETAPEASKPIAPIAKKSAAPATGAAKCELSGKKWNVEHQVGNQDITIDASMKQTLYVYKCRDSLIKVNGKINAIVLDSCSKTACVFEEAMATLEIVNSKDIQVQCMKTAPAMTIDGCTAVTYYMSSSFADCQIITAKSAAINLIRPTEDDDVSPTDRFATFKLIAETIHNLTLLTLNFSFLGLQYFTSADRRDAHSRAVFD